MDMYGWIRSAQVGFRHVSCATPAELVYEWYRLSRIKDFVGSFLWFILWYVSVLYLYKVVLSFSWYQTLMKSRQTIKYIKSFFFGLYSVLYYVICNVSLGLVCIWFHVFVSNCNFEIKIIHQSEMQESMFKMKNLKLNIVFHW